MNQSTNIKSHDLILLAILYILFPIFGLFDATKGTLAISIKEFFGVNYTALGTMMTIGMLGWTIGVFFSGIIAERKGSRPVIISGVLLAGIGLVAMRFVESFVAACILLFLIFLGFACFEIGSSIIARLPIKRVAILMSLYIFAYSAGNIAGPFFASRLIAAGQTWQQIFSYLAIPLFVCLILIVFNAKRQSASRQPVYHGKMDWGVFRSKDLWLMMILLGLAITIEFGIVNWLVSYLENIVSYTFQQSSNFLSVYFVVFAAGRFVGGYITHKIGWRRTLMIMSILMLGLFIPGVLLGRTGVWFLLPFGFCTAVVFPTILFAISKCFKNNISSIIGIAIAAASCINLFFSFLIGLVSDLLGVLYGFNVIALCSLLAIVIVQILARAGGKNDAEILEQIDLGDDK